MKRIAIFGSTGSIGKSTLEIARRFPDKFTVVGLSANSNIDILYRQIKEFSPALACVNDISAGLKLRPKLKRTATRLLTGEDGLRQMAADPRIDEIVLAISGSSALSPLLKAIDCGKTVALSNKEALVMAGDIIMDRARKTQAKIIPIDSEQSAIWQCLDGQAKDKLKNIYLTASGGPFRRVDIRKLKNISISRVLKHPRWKMGKKISVDSATLMNKGFEVLEAMHLFGVPPDKIKVIIHPEAIIHSMVEFIDGVILGQLSVTDMRIPIQYALLYPERLPSSLPGVDFFKLKELNFQKPDFKRFPCLKLAYLAADEGGTMPAVLNAANEVSVDAFLRKRLNFIAIPAVIKRVLERHKNKRNPDLNEILDADAWARQESYRVIGKII